MATSDDDRPAVDVVREGILTGQFAPRQRLVEADLCELFGLSRASARAALQQLATEGLVEIRRNRGARVRAISLEEAIEITEIRMVVEGFVARMAAERVTPEDARDLRAMISEMKKAVKSLETLSDYGDLNVKLHARIRAIAGHATANRVIAQLNAQTARQHIRRAMYPGRAATSLGQHEAVVTAICKRDGDAAELAMQSHIRSVTEALRLTSQTP